MLSTTSFEGKMPVTHLMLHGAGDIECSLRKAHDEFGTQCGNKVSQQRPQGLLCFMNCNKKCEIHTS